MIRNIKKLWEGREITTEEEKERRKNDYERIEKLEGENFNLCGNVWSARNHLRRILKEKIIRLKKEKESLVEKLKIKKTIGDSKNLMKVQSELNFYENERDFPEHFKKVVMSKVYYLSKRKKEDGTVYLEMGTTVRKGNDGHEISKGGFAKKNFNETLDCMMFSSASKPERVSNHYVLGQSLGPENKETYFTTLQPLSLDCDKLNGKIMKEDFYIRLSWTLQDGKSTMLSTWLIENNIVKNSNITGKNSILVKVRNELSYQADMKSLKLSFSNVGDVYSAFGIGSNKTRKTDDLQDKTKYPSIVSLFVYPDVLFPVIIRSSTNLIFLKTIPTILRRADIDLHGLTRATNSIVQQGVTLAGQNNIGMKKGSLEVMVESGLVSESCSGSKKNPLSFSHTKVEMFQEKYESQVKPKLLKLYREKLKKFEENLKEEVSKLERNAFRSERKRDSCKTKIETLENKIKKTKELIFHHEVYIADVFLLLRITGEGRLVEKQEGYFPHDPEWIKKEFTSFETIKSSIVPILLRIQESLSRISKETDSVAHYLNHLVREYILYLTVHFSCRDNQRTMEYLGCAMNRLYRNSSFFGGRERAVPRVMKTSGIEKVTQVNRQIDSLVTAMSKMNIRKTWEQENKNKN